MTCKYISRDTLLKKQISALTIFLLSDLFRVQFTSPYISTGVLTRVEAGSNTSTVTLRVVRGDEIGLKVGHAIA
jgi:hypothetical protein